MKSPACLLLARVSHANLSIVMKFLFNFAISRLCERSEAIQRRFSIEIPNWIASLNARKDEFLAKLNLIGSSHFKRTQDETQRLWKPVLYLFYS